jgi:predicted nucleic acid-binding Zn ribbon protein
MSLIDNLRNSGCRSECELHEDREEAADELERLTEQNKGLGDLVHKRGNDLAFARREMKKAQSEIKRLRDALTALVDECDECGSPFEVVRPGKSQPTCDCQDACPNCGTMRRHFAVGEIARLRSGFLCPVCDADEANKEPS